MGPTLEVVDSEGDYNDPLNWRASTFNGGTPGAGLVLDADGDGLSDSDELLAGTDPLNPGSDFDGALDGAEVAAGTDPLDQNSLFELTILTRDPGTGFVTVTWSGIPGRSYTLQAKADLSGPWVDVASGVVASGTSTSRLDTGAGGQSRMFYRAYVE